MTATATNNIRTTRATQSNADGTMQHVPAGVAKTIRRTAASYPVLTKMDDTHFQMCGIAPIAGYTIHTSVDTRTVYKRAIAGTHAGDATDYTAIGVIGVDGTGFAHDCARFCAFIELEDGTWLLFANEQTSGNGACHFVYRSTKAGATLQSDWVAVCGTFVADSPAYESEHGTTNRIHADCACGTYVVYGEYTDSDNYGGENSIYLSRDSGMTWELVYQEADLHWHLLSFGYNGDTDTIYASTGDTILCNYMFTYSGGTWTKTTLTSTDGGENTWFLPISDTKVLHGTSYLVTEYDTEKPNRISRLRLPIPVEGGTAYSYDYGFPGVEGAADVQSTSDRPGSCNVVVDNSGNIYVAFRSWLINNTLDGSGLYVSADKGKTWSCVHRVVGDVGFDKIFFDSVGNKIYGNYHTGKDTSIDVYSFPALNCRTVSALRLSSQYGNRIKTQQDATATTTAGAANIGSWTAWPYDGGRVKDDLLEAVAGGCDGGDCLHFKTRGPNVGTGIAGAIWSGLLTSAGILDTTPGNAAYFMAKCKIKAPDAPSNYAAILTVSPDYADMGNTTQKRGQCYFCLGNEWQEITAVGVFTGAHTNYKIVINVQPPSGTDVANLVEFDVYVDDIRFYFHDTARVLDSNNDNTLPIVYPALDAAVVPLTGLGTSWTIAFDAIHACTYEFGKGVLAPYLASVVNDSGIYNQLYVDSSSGVKYYLFDGTNWRGATITNPTRHFDQRRFYLVCDGSKIVGYIYTPDAGLLTTATGASIPVPNPTALYLGCSATLLASTSFPGDYWNVKTWTKALSTGEITTDLLTAGISIPSTTGSGIPVIGGATKQIGT